MKRTFSFALVLVLVLSMAVPAFATSSVTASEEDLTPTQTVTQPATDTETTTDAPEQTDGNLIITNAENVEDLPQQAQETFAESKEVLTTVTTEKNASVSSMFYATPVGDVDKSDAGFEVEDYREPIVMQYVDGEWVELEVEINDDQTITVKDVVEGPIAFMVPQEPFLVSSSNDEVIVVGEDKVKDLPREDRRNFSEAKKQLGEAVPEGMLVRNIFYVDNAHIDDNVSAVFEIGSFRGLVVKQYHGKKWHEREHSKNNDGTITVHGLTNGPTMFCVK